MSALHDFLKQAALKGNFISGSTVLKKEDPIFSVDSGYVVRENNLS
jgi:hypothetical protein